MALYMRSCILRKYACERPDSYGVDSGVFTCTRWLRGSHPIGERTVERYALEAPGNETQGVNR